MSRVGEGHRHVEGVLVKGEGLLTDDIAMHHKLSTQPKGVLPRPISAQQDAMKTAQVEATPIFIFAPGFEEPIALIIVGINQVTEPAKALSGFCTGFKPGAICKFCEKFLEIIRMIERFALAEDGPIG